MARRVLIDGIDTLLIDPRSTTGQPDGWGWDWERWRLPHAQQHQTPDQRTHGGLLFPGQPDQGVMRTAG